MCIVHSHVWAQVSLLVHTCEGSRLMQFLWIACPCSEAGSLTGPTLPCQSPVSARLPSLWPFHPHRVYMSWALLLPRNALDTEPFLQLLITVVFNSVCVCVGQKTTLGVTLIVVFTQCLYVCRREDNPRCHPQEYEHFFGNQVSHWPRAYRLG